MSQRSVTPLLVGTFILRASGAAGTVVYGLFLAQLALHTHYVITSLEVGFLSAAFYVAELTLAPLMGALSDHWGRRYFLTFGPLLGVLQTLLVLFAPMRNPLPYLLSLQIVSGLSSAMLIPAVLGYLADYTVRSHSLRMRVMSFFELATSGGIAAGVVIGGFTWDRFGRYAFALLAGLYVLVACCMLLAPRVKQIIERGDLRAIGARYWSVVRKPRLFIFIPAWICICALVGVWLSSQVTFLLSMHRHFPHQSLVGAMAGPGGGRTLSLVLGGYVLFFGLSLLFWAFFLGHVPRLRLMLTSVTGVYLACIALAGINHSGLGSISQLFLWTPLLLAGIFAESSFAPAALAYLADISEEAARDRGLLMGLYSIFLGLGQLLGNGLGGAFARVWGFDGLIYLTVIFACIALISLLVLYRFERKISQVSG